MKNNYFSRGQHDALSKASRHSAWLLLFLFFITTQSFALKPTIVNYYSGGSGTALSPYLISTSDNLISLAANSQHWGAGTYFKQTADIDISSVSNWSGIGISDVAYFAGVYDGDGYKITGLTITNLERDYQGLFGYVGMTGEIKNLSVQGSITSSFDQVGMMAGIFMGTMENCHASGTISGSGDYHGGMIGKMIGYSAAYQATAYNCGSSVSLSFPGLLWVRGGFVAFLNALSVIDACFASGNVIGTGTGQVSAWDVGGFAGVCYGKISNSYASGNVNGGWRVGGFVGQTYTSDPYYPFEIAACYSSGAVTATASYYAGFIGSYNGGTVIESCYDYMTSGQLIATGGVENDAWANNPDNACYGLSTTQMQTPSTFTALNWDILTWSLVSGSYPKLLWEPVPATIATLEQDSVSCVWAKLGFEITDEGSGTISERGVVYSVLSTNENPLINGTGVTKQIFDINLLEFSDFVFGLSPETTYVAKAFVTSSAGTSYGDTIMFTTPAAFGSGTGLLISSPKEITNLADLVYLSTKSNLWSNYFKITADIDATLTRKMNPDGNGGFYGFSPIASNSQLFTGGFDGGGHIISNLYINRPLSSDPIGLFGSVQTNTPIKSFGLVNADITGASNTGGIIGFAQSPSPTMMNPTPGSGALYDCFVKGVVRGTTNVGGLIGSMSNVYSLHNCFAIGIVDGSGNYVGGLVGYLVNSHLHHSYAVVKIDQNPPPGNGRSILGLGLPVSSSFNFYNSDSTTTTDFIEIAVAKTTTEMKTQATYIAGTNGFDFVGETANGQQDYWRISSSRNNGFPSLSWQPYEIDCSLASSLGSETYPILQATSEIGNTNFTVNWDESDCADGYYLDVAYDSLFVNFVNGFENKDLGNVLTYEVNGLSINDTLYYRLRGYNSYHTSGQSDTIAVVLTPSHFLVGDTYHQHLHDAAADASYGESIELLHNYTLTNDMMLASDARLDLKGFTFGGLNSTITIGSMKQLILINTAQTNGSFNVPVAFASTMSVLGLNSGVLLGSDFSTSGNNLGSLVLGDGTMMFSFTMDAQNVAKFSKINSITVKSNSGLNLNADLSTASINLADGALLQVGDGDYEFNLQSISSNFSTAIVKSDDCTFSGDWTNFYGDLEINNGKTTWLDFAAQSQNPFRISIGTSSNTETTTLVKKGGAYSIGNNGNSMDLILYPKSVLDLTDSDNTGDLSVLNDVLFSGNIAQYPGKIKFILSSAPGGFTANGLAITNGAIYSVDDINGTLKVDLNFQIDMDSLIGYTNETTYDVSLVTVNEYPVLDNSSVSPLNVAYWWENHSIFAQQNSSSYSLKFSSYYHPGNPPVVGTHGTSSWVENQPAGDVGKMWRTTSISSDGSKMMAGAQNGRLYFAENGTWTEQQPAGDVTASWFSSALSSDGSIRMAGAFGGRLYAYTSGQWNEIYPPGGNPENKNWTAIAMSSDGSKRLAGTQFGGLYYYSNNQWSIITPAGNINTAWMSLGMSADGSKMIACQYDVTNGGRVFIYSNGNWNETYPAGNVTKQWKSVSISADGSKMLAGEYTGRLYLYEDGVWTETQPAGNTDQYWLSTSISTNGSKMIAGANNNFVYIWENDSWTAQMTQEYAYWSTVAMSTNGSSAIAGASVGRLKVFSPTASITNLTATSATSKGIVLNADEKDIISRGIIYYPYSDTVKVIGSNAVLNLQETGTYTEGQFSQDISNLSPATRYSARAHASSLAGIGYGDKVDFYTLPNVPAIPTINNPQLNSLDVTINTNSNPVSVEYAIQDSIGGKYVNTQGALGDSASWQTATNWGTKTVTGLTPGTIYKFRVKARNASQDETTFGLSASAYPYAAPTVLSEGDSLIGVNPVQVSHFTTTSARTYGSIDEINGSSATNRGVIWYPYSDTSKVIGAYLVTNLDESGTYAEGAFSKDISGLNVNTRYSFLAHATNEGGISYGDKVNFYTLANVPASPGLENDSYNTMLVSLHANGNPGYTEYAIYDSLSAKYVQANGTLNTTAVWQTESSWENQLNGTARKVLDLAANTQYAFQVKARNGENNETDFSVATLKYTLAVMPETLFIAALDTLKLNLEIDAPDNSAETQYAIYEPELQKFVQIDGSLDTDSAWQTETAWETSVGNSMVEVNGLSHDAEFTFKVKARNGNKVETDYAAGQSLFTLAQIPGSPIVINPTASSLDVIVVPNGNPATTLFAIQDSSATSSYVQANGTRGQTAVWQTAEQWDTVTVSGLTVATYYYFRVKAKNGDGLETDFSLSTEQITCSNPTNPGSIGSAQAICSGLSPDSLTSLSLPSNYGGTLEYQWQKSTLTDSTGFTDIVDATGLGYQPGTLTTTTWYRRMTRVSCKDNWTGAPVSNAVKIEVYELPVATFSSTDILCYGYSTGSIDLSVSSGTSPYTYLWSNNATTEDINNLPIGVYSVIVTDANSCTTSRADTLTQPDLITANAGLDRQICYDTTVVLSGSFTVAPSAIWSGGTGSFSPSATNMNAKYIPSAQDIEDGEVTIYLTTTDNGTCTAAKDSLLITIYPEPKWTYTINNESYITGTPIEICDGVTVDAVASDFVGTFPFQGKRQIYFNGSIFGNEITFNTSPATEFSQSNQLPIGEWTNLYTELQDAHGCITTEATLLTFSPMVSINPNPTAIIDSNDPVCEGETIQLNAYYDEVACTTDCSLPLTYCQSAANIGGYQYIDEFILGKTSSANYGGFDKIALPIFKTLYLDSTYSVSVDIAGPMAYDHYTMIFVDWNRDGDFEDIGEAQQVGSAQGVGPVLSTLSVPFNATLGKTMLRLVNRKNAYATACGSYPVGETEDYPVEIKTVDPQSITNYAWSGPAGSSSSKVWGIANANELSHSGVYEVTVTNTHGCTTETSHTVIVANPQIDFSSIETAQEAPFTLQLNPGSFQNYEWSNGSSESTLTVNEFGTYTVTVSDYQCTVSESITITEVQQIYLQAGWNIFSTYLNQTADIADVLEDFTAEVVIVKNGSGMAYWPAQSINMIGNMVVGAGYQIKMNTQQLLEIAGTAVVPQNIPLQLNSGASIFGVLTTNPVEVTELFGGIATSVIYVKSNSGASYLPNFNVNQIESLYPDQGYKLLMSQARVISFPANSNNPPTKSESEIAELQYYTEPVNSGSNMTLLIPAAVLRSIAEMGDEFAVVTATGGVSGAAVYEGENLVITIWGQDRTVREKTGLAASESFILEQYNHQNGATTRYEQMEFEMGNNRFSENSLAVIKSLNLNLNLNLNLYPNPATDFVEVNLTLPEGSESQLEIYNGIGQLMYSKTMKEAGNQIEKISVSSFSSGIYTLRLRSKGEIREMSFVVK